MSEEKTWVVQALTCHWDEDGIFKWRRSNLPEQGCECDSCFMLAENRQQHQPVSLDEGMRIITEEIKTRRGYADADEHPARFCALRLFNLETSDIIMGDIL